jgi:hypothetical protein
MSVFDIAEFTALPPDANAVFCTLVGDVAGTLTVRINTGRLDPAVTISPEVQETALVPMQAQ